jgi:hypothetical protein
MTWKGYERKLLWLDVMFTTGCPGICLEGLMKTTKHFSRDSRFPVHDLNLGPLEQEVGVQSLCRNVRCKSPDVGL